MICNDISIWQYIDTVDTVSIVHLENHYIRNTLIEQYMAALLQQYCNKLCSNHFY